MDRIRRMNELALVASLVDPVLRRDNEILTETLNDYLHDLHTCERQLEQALLRARSNEMLANVFEAEMRRLQRVELALEERIRVLEGRLLDCVCNEETFEECAMMQACEAFLPPLESDYSSDETVMDFDN